MSSSNRAARDAPAARSAASRRSSRVPASPARPARPSRPATPDDSCPKPAAPNAIDVYRAVAAGDPLAMEIADAVGRRVAWAVHLLVMAYDVERVVLGGGVSHAGVDFARPILRELDRLRATSALAQEQLVPGSWTCCHRAPMPGHGVR